MTELVLKKKTLNIKYEGKDYELSFPSVLQTKNFVKNLEKKGNNEIEESIKLITELGLPKDVCEAIDIDQLNMIMEAITPQSKKK